PSGAGSRVTEGRDLVRPAVGHRVPPGRSRGPARVASAAAAAHESFPRPRASPWRARSLPRISGTAETPTTEPTNAAMISRQDILRLLHRPEGQVPVLSVFLDMSVNEVNQ